MRQQPKTDLKSTWYSPAHWYRFAWREILMKDSNPGNLNISSDLIAN